MLPSPCSRGERGSSERVEARQVRTNRKEERQNADCSSVVLKDVLHCTEHEVRMFLRPGV
jgi:hypothetical protein